MYSYSVKFRLQIPATTALRPSMNQLPKMFR